MALIVEDGSNVTDAESYATVAELRAYAAKRGLTVPVADADCEALLLTGAAYVETFWDRFRGARANNGQALSWPRAGVYLFDDTEPFDSDAIPSQLINAQCQAAIDGQSTTIFPIGPGREVVSEKVDVIEKAYAQGGVTNPRSVLNAVNALLAPLLSGSGYGSLETVRA